jgi:hypothetical protein
MVNQINHDIVKRIEYMWTLEEERYFIVNPYTGEINLPRNELNMRFNYGLDLQPDQTFVLGNNGNNE